MYICKKYLPSYMYIMLKYGYILTIIINLLLSRNGVKFSFCYIGIKQITK